MSSESIDFTIAVKRLNQDYAFSVFVVADVAAGVIDCVDTPSFVLDFGDGACYANAADVALETPVKIFGIGGVGFERVATWGWTASAFAVQLAFLCESFKLCCAGTRDFT